jgi:hypothetical protein
MIRMAVREHTPIGEALMRFVHAVLPISLTLSWVRARSEPLHALSPVGLLGSHLGIAPSVESFGFFIALLLQAG